MITVHWVVGIWAVSSIACVTFERLVPRASIWDPNKPRDSVAKYSLLVLLSPFAVVSFASIAVFEYSRIGWRRLIGKPVWLDDDVLVRLVKRRQKYDERLKDEKISGWPGWRLWDEPEYLIHDISKKFLTLETEGVNPLQILQKLEAFRAEFGNGEMPSSPTLSEYVKYRLGIEAPEYAALGEELLQQQLKDCRTHVLYQIDKTIKEADYPSPNVLQRKLSVNEIEQLGVGSESTTFRRNMFDLKFRLLDDDVMWTYGGSLTHGVALVWDGKIIDHVVTAWTCRSA